MESGWSSPRIETLVRRGRRISSLPTGFPRGLSTFEPAEPLRVVQETYLSRKPEGSSLWIAAASVAVLFLTSWIYWTDAFGLGSQLAASPESVFDRKEYWRLFTAIGAHADSGHLFGNAVVFGVLSYLLYGYFGVFVYPLLTLISGAVVMGLALATYPPLTILIGASGVVYLMAGFWLTLYLFLERRFSPAKRLLRSVGFSLVVLMPTVVEPTVSYRTHALGFGAGVILGVAYFRLNKDRLRRAERVEMESDD
jgi:membrane associated rhomboid family serine protease